VAVAGPIVRKDSLLGGRFDVLEPRRDMAGFIADAFALGKRHCTFEDVERGARVATGEADEMLERRVIDGDTAVRPERAGQPAVRVIERPADHDRDLVVGQRLQPPDPHP
jgi:hypothetical protein